MAIFSWMGAPVEIIEAEKRRRWWLHLGSRTLTFDKPPAKSWLKRAKEQSEFDIWWIRARQIGAYPDGSGKDDIGKIMSGRSDLTKRGFTDETYFRADGGIAEIHRECERVRQTALTKQTGRVDRSGLTGL